MKTIELTRAKNNCSTVCEPALSGRLLLAGGVLIAELSVTDDIVSAEPTSSSPELLMLRSAGRSAEPNLVAYWKAQTVWRMSE